MTERENAKQPKTLVDAISVYLDSRRLCDIWLPGKIQANEIHHLSKNLYPSRLPSHPEEPWLHP